MVEKSDYAVYEDGVIQMILINRDELEVSSSVLHYNRVGRGKKYSYKKVFVDVKEV